MSPLSQQLLMQPGFCPVCLDSSCPVGLHWCMAPDLLSVNLKIMSQVLSAAGSIHPELASWGGMLKVLSDYEKPSCVPRVARELGSRSLPLHQATTLASTLSCSVLCFFVAFTCLNLLLLISAGGRPIDALGIRADCARMGVLGRRGFAVESVAARICREVGGRVTTNVLVRDLDLAAPNVRDARRLDGRLPLLYGAQLAVDTTLVSALHCDGSAIRGAPNSDGIALAFARRRKEPTYLELV